MVLYGKERYLSACVTRLLYLCQRKPIVLFYHQQGQQHIDLLIVFVVCSCLEVYAV